VEDEKENKEIYGLIEAPRPAHACLRLGNDCHKKAGMSRRRRRRGLLAD